MSELTPHYFIDMDGVLAVYERRAYEGKSPLWLQRGSHYFYTCKPDKRMLTLLETLIADHEPLERRRNSIGKLYEVTVLTSVSNIGSMFLEHCHDKRRWLSQHAPYLDLEHEFIATPSPKRRAVENILSRKLAHTDVLIDDYNHNLLSWAEAGGTAVKYLNGLNSQESYDGPCIDEAMTTADIIEMLGYLTRT